MSGTLLDENVVTQLEPADFVGKSVHIMPTDYTFSRYRLILSFVEINRGRVVGVTKNGLLEVIHTRSGFSALETRYDLNMSDVQLLPN